MDRGVLGLGGPPGEAGADKKRFNGWLNKLNLYSRGSFHLCGEYWGVRKKEEGGGATNTLPGDNGKVSGVRPAEEITFTLQKCI